MHISLREHITLWLNKDKHNKNKRKSYMYKKLLSNLPYNPSLIGQVSFYASRIHAEEKLRRLGLVFVALAMVVQVFAGLSRPESSLAASPNDIIPGGFSSHSQANSHCASNNHEFRTILEHYGITCDDVARANTQNVRSTDYDRKLLSMGRLPFGKAGERPVTIQGKTYYQRYLWAWDSGPFSTYQSLVGRTANGMPFIILYNCGNLTIVETPPPAPTPTPTPAPTPDPRPLQAGSALCERLDPTRIQRLRYRFQAVTSGDFYRVKSYTFTFGDGESRTVNTSRRTVSVTHTYDEPGTYTIRASISAEIRQPDRSYRPNTLTCVTTVSIEGIPPTEAPQETPPETPEPVDRCPDVEGIQLTLSECDVCPLIRGVQSSPEECKPCAESNDDTDTIACIALSKTVRNRTQNIDDANGTMANANDVIIYTLRTANDGKIAVSDYVIEEPLADVLEYADVVNLHGGTLGEDNIVRWRPVTINPGRSINKTITVRVKDPIPQTPIPASNPGTYDLVMTNVYGNSTNITLPGSIAKTTEQVVQVLPNTGPTSSTLFAVAFTMTAGYFFARSRLYAKELDIVKHDYTTSGSY